MRVSVRSNSEQRHCKEQPGVSHAPSSAGLAESTCWYRASVMRRHSTG